MKNRVRFYSTALLLSTVPFVTLSCKKDEPGSAAGVISGGSTEALSASSWGFAAKLPKSTEGFVALYRLADIWTGVKDSNFLKKLKAHPEFSKGFTQMEESFNKNPDAQEAAAIAGALLGKEAVLAVPEGFAENLVKIIKSLEPLSGFFLQQMKAGMGGRNAPPVGDDAFMLWVQQNPQAVSAVIEGLSNSEFPPLLVAVNGASVREKLDGLVKQALGSIPPEGKQALEEGSFKVDSHSFQSLTLKLSKAVPPDGVEGIKAQMGQLIGDPAKAASLTEKLLTKTVEISWGWVDDYLVVSLGKDHSHVKLSGLADSALSLPEIAGRVAAWQAKKPFSLSYSSQKSNQLLADASGSMTDSLIALVQMAGSESPVPLEPLVADLKKLGKRAAELWPDKLSAIVASSWWDGGLRAETFGGPKPNAFDSSKPLTYGSLAGKATVFLSESRVNEASREAFGFAEEVFSTLYANYEKNIKPALPDETKQQVGMGEAMALPMLKSIWKSIQDFRAALGSESALLVNLDGTMPDIPQLGVPPEMKGAKIPRILMVSDLKDAAKLSESWSGIGVVITGIATMSGSGINPVPVEKKDGAVTMWGFELPMDTGDVWPHTAVAGNRFYMGTSPSFTKEAAAKTPTATGPASGAHVSINFDAVWDYAGSMIGMMPNLPEQKQNMREALEFARALGEIDFRTGEDKGDSHSTIYIRITDLK